MALAKKDISRVDYAGETLIDLTDATVTPETLVNGEIAYNGAGKKVYGTLVLGKDVKELIERSIVNFDIPSNYTKLGPYAFAGCSKLKTLSIPDWITTIGDHAFEFCDNLVSITIPNGITDISNSCFKTCRGLTSVTLPSNLISIGESAFNFCTILEQLDIPVTVTSIKSYAFSGCYRLKKMAIPKGVMTINTSTFASCSSLLELDFSNHTSVPTLASTYALTGTSNNMKIKVPSSLIEEWKTATNWSIYASRIVGV